MPRASIRVMVVDDHEVVRAGIAALLEREPDLEVVGTAGSGEEALELVDGLVPDVVVLDHRLPGMSGAAACREIVRRRPATSVVVLTTYLDDGVIHACLAAGAHAYLLKGASGSDLVHAVRAVARGEAVLAPQVVDRVLEWARRAKAIYQEGESLAPHELVVLSLAAQGMSNGEIATRLQMSERTIKAYLSSAMRKLGVTQRAQAVATGILRGLI